GTLRAIVAGGGVPAPGALRADRWFQAVGGGAWLSADEAPLGPVAGGGRADGQGGHLRAESGRGSDARAGRSLDYPGPGPGGWVKSSGGGGVVGTSQDLGMPPPGPDRALGHGGAGGTARGPALSHRSTTDGAVAGGQPSRSAGRGPAGGAVERGTGRS